jgi:outer membrane protein OmpA-like peptidoglycan-associated protein
MRLVKSLVLACAAGAVLAGWGAAPAAAEQAVMMGKNPTECEISAALGVNKPGCPAAIDQPARKKPGTRGLAIGNIDQMPSAPPPAAAPAAEQTKPKKQYKAAFEINFEFGSARLTEDSKQILDRLASVMNAPDAGSTRFLIEGHTDGVGSASRNQKLSEARAEAVRDYLTASHQINLSRLRAVGKGSRELLKPGDPSAGENRRVEITNLGS